ncbi:MAG: hypothetical protein NTV46_10560, partial [Verrucomicrobia bacterium]|nr:hypothetical protein [Verrucomicrobiota bacterium]
CTVWNTSRAGSASFDGFTSATAQNYTAVAPPAIGNNPITVNWNCTDVDKVTVVPDGTYNFFIQYAEDTSLAPVTSALTWIKGPSPHSPVIANQGSSGSPTNGNNFTDISITWTPAGAATPPAFTSGAPPAGKVGTAYSHNLKASGTTPITFGSTGTLPSGLTLTNGVLSGTPTTAGTFTGTFTASNGTTPNASQ